jgi:hypothetical protein
MSTKKNQTSKRVIEDLAPKDNPQGGATTGAHGAGGGGGAGKVSFQDLHFIAK